MKKRDGGRKNKTTLEKKIQQKQIANRKKMTEVNINK